MSLAQLLERCCRLANETWLPWSPSQAWLESLSGLICRCFAAKYLVSSAASKEWLLAFIGITTKHTDNEGVCRRYRPSSMSLTKARVSLRAALSPSRVNRDVKIRRSGDLPCAASCSPPSWNYCVFPEYTARRLAYLLVLPASPGSTSTRLNQHIWAIRLYIFMCLKI